MSLIYHVYALCYNEEKIIPYFLHHYRSADKIIILDNCSTDNTLTYINDFMTKHPTIIEIITFDTNNSFNDERHKEIKNTIWKQSIGVADYVIVQDMDEFLHFSNSDIKSGLLYLKNLKIPIIRPIGLNMICTTSEFDHIATDSLVHSTTNGFYSFNYSKPQVFNPNYFTNVTFTVGNHAVETVPVVTPYTSDKIYLLHYKHLGFEYNYGRGLQWRDRMIPVLGYNHYSNDATIHHDLSIQYMNKIDLRPVIFDRKVIGDVAGFGSGLCGRMGNQLFVIATTMAVAYEYGMSYCFRFHNGLPLQYSCLYFNDAQENYTQIVEVNQNKVTFNIDQNTKNVNIAGYFQSSSYFNKYKYQVCMKIKELIRMPTLPQQPVVGIHVRRTDYETLGWALPLSYYNNAMNKFDPSTSFMIVTDDKAWCEQNFPNIPIVRSETDLDDFYYLTSVQSMILSNSTFAWWAAYLGDMSRVIAPTPWFKNTAYNKDIYEEKWEQLAY